MKFIKDKGSIEFKLSENEGFVVLLIIVCICVAAC